jgi:GAF domain-containing protein
VLAAAGVHRDFDSDGQGDAMKAAYAADVLKASSIGTALAVGYAAIWFGGGAGSFDPQILYGAIILATFWVGPLGSASVGLAAGLLAGPFMPYDTSTGQMQSLIDWGPRLCYFTAVGGVIGFINGRLRERASALVETAEQLRRRTAEALEAKERADWASGELAAISSTALSLVADQALSAVLQRIADLSREVVRAKYAALAVVGQDGRVREFITSGISRERHERIGAPPAFRGVLGAILDGQTVRTHDVMAHPEFSGFPDHHPKMRQLLGVPVHYKGRILAALYLCEPASGDGFTAEDEHALKLFAAHAAAAIANASLYEAQQQKMSELGVFNRMDAAILANATEQELAEMTVREVRELFASRVCLVFRTEGDALLLAAGDGEIAEEARRVTSPPIRLGVGAVGWAVLQREVTVVADYATDPRGRPVRELCARLGLRSAIAAPLLEGETALGALFIGYAEPRTFSSEETERAARFADRLSLGIQHARQQERLRRMTLETVMALAEAIESRDPYTGGHCVRLVEYAELIAQELGVTGQELEVIRYGAALHDCGKVGVPDTVLKKVGPLSPDEWAAMRLHPYIGGQLCKRVSFLRPIAPIVYHHHERYDGSGYPDGLKGKEIPLGARIIAVADAYDSMTCERPYRDALGHEHALRELRRYAGIQFDPDCVEAFIRAIEQKRAAERPDVSRAA